MLGHLSEMSLVDRNVAEGSDGVGVGGGVNFMFIIHYLLTPQQRDYTYKAQVSLVRTKMIKPG